MSTPPVTGATPPPVTPLATVPPLATTTTPPLAARAVLAPQPPQRPVLANIAQAASPFATPTQDQLDSFNAVVSSNLLPNQAQLQAIINDLVAINVPLASATTVCLELANYCYDNGSSAATVISGDSSVTNVPLRRVASAVRDSGTSLRKLCRYFAPVIWNLRTDRTPPANWEASGFKPSEKFAAFDFFDGVENPAAMQPPGGLVREPSQAERIANNTAKQIHLFEAAARDNNFASNSNFVTRGHISANAPTIQFLPPPE